MLVRPQTMGDLSRVRTVRGAILPRWWQVEHSTAKRIARAVTDVTRRPPPTLGANDAAQTAGQLRHVSVSAGGGPPEYPYECQRLVPVPTAAQFPVQACAAPAWLSPKLAANPIDVSLARNPRPTVMLAL